MTRWPCAIIGAGAAGVNAAAWMHSYHVSPLWLTDGAVGGILNRVNNPLREHPEQHYARGKDLAKALRDRLAQAPYPGPTQAKVSALVWQEDHWLLRCDDDTTHRARAVILATGTRYRRLEVPGEAALLGRGVSQSVSADAQQVAGQSVAVVGAGDAALEGALILAARGCEVHLLCRDAPSPERARAAFISEVKAHPNITSWPVPTQVVAIEGGPTPDAPLTLRLRGASGAGPSTLRVAALFVRVGIAPLIPQITPAPATDAGGYLIVDATQATSAPNLFAAGDVTHLPLRAVASAYGAGARAAHSAAQLVRR